VHRHGIARGWIIIGDGPLAVGKGAPDSGGIVGAPHEPPWNLGARDLRQRTEQRRRVGEEG